MNASVQKLIAAIIVCQLAAHAQDPAVGPARFSAAQLREAIAASQKRIGSFYLEYESDDYKGEAKAAGAYLHRIVAAKGPSSFLHISAHGYSNVNWRDDPEMQRAILTKDGLWNAYDVNRAYVRDSLAEDAPLTGSLPLEFLFYATGLYPLTARPAPTRDDDKGPVALRDIANNPDFSVVRPLTELVDGRACHVLERPGLDVIWLDVERDCCLMAREFYSKKNGRLMWKIVASGHAAAGDGVWVARKLRNLQYNYNAPVAADRLKPVVDTESEILEARINEVDDDLFKFTERPGHLLLSDGQPIQTESGGTEHLDNLVTWSKNTFAFRWQTPGLEREATWVKPAKWFALGACGVLLLWMIKLPAENNSD